MIAWSRSKAPAWIGTTRRTTWSKSSARSELRAAPGCCGLRRDALGPRIARQHRFARHAHLRVRIDDAQRDLDRFVARRADRNASVVDFHLPRVRGNRADATDLRH